MEQNQEIGNLHVNTSAFPLMAYAVTRYFAKQGLKLPARDIPTLRRLPMVFEFVNVLPYR